LYIISAVKPSGMKEENYRVMAKDVAVVGGSTSGFFTASLLARKGCRVRLYEADEKSGPAPRTLIVTSAMRDVLGALSDRCVVNQIRHFELYTDGRVATISLRRPDLVVERSLLIEELERSARDEGVAVHTGASFEDLRPAPGGLLFKISREGTTSTEKAHAVVGADGAFSRVARCAGWPDRPKAALTQAVVRLPSDMAPDTTRVWFLPDETPYFFWLIPQSETQGVLGLIASNPDEGKLSLERFMERKGLIPESIQEAKVPLYNRWTFPRKRMGEGEVYLVGDAAGQVKVSTVGGIVTGFRGAVGAAEAISNGGSSGEFRVLKRELDRHRLIRRLLNRFEQRDYSRLLDALNDSVRRSLATFTRDETGRFLWRMVLYQPRFLLLGLRAFLKI